MDAVILAGGMGSRLRPITDNIPKSLVPLDGIPILEWQIRYLAHHGTRRVIICTGYMQEQIQNFVEARKLGVQIHISSESSPLGTGGAIKKASKHVRTKSAIIMNGDVITNIDLGKVASVIDSIAAVRLRTRYGVLGLEGDRVCTFDEKKQIAGMWMNAGIYHLSAKTMRAMPRQGNAETTLFPKMADGGKLQVTRFPKAQWYSIDSHKDLVECASKVKSILRPSRAVKH